LTIRHIPKVRGDGPKVIVSIQYLRGVAALAVVWHHATTQVPGMSEFLPWDFGVSGVDLFFVISGFIMVVTTAESSITPTQFWWRRISRVVPIYWLLTLLMVCVALVAPGLFKTLRIEPLKLMQSLLFIPHFSASFPAFAWPVLVPGWTLNFEMFFYAVFGASLIMPPRWRLWTVSIFFVGLTALGMFAGPFKSAMAQTYTSPMLIEFVAGALIGARWAKRPWRAPFWLSLIKVAGGATLLVLRDHGPLGQFSQAAGAALMVIGALDHHFSAWRSRTLQAVGDSSYSLYLTHIFTLGLLRVAFVKTVSAAPNLFIAGGFMLLALPACVIVGWVTFRWLEAPVSRRLSHTLRSANNPSIVKNTRSIRTDSS